MPIDLTDSRIDLSPLALDATEAERNEKINAILTLARPLRQISGINGVRVHMSDSNIIVETDPDGADDAGGATENNSGSVGTPDTTADTTPGPVDHGDFGDPFEPGDASTPGAAVVYETRIRSGVATLVGYSEFTSASTPPKKYLTNTYSGGMRGDVYSNGGCTSFAGYFTINYTGAATYSATTGLLVSYGNQAISENGGAISNYNVSNVFTASAASCFGAISTPSSTLNVLTTSGSCCAGTGDYQKHTNPGAFRTNTLSVEDTDANAVTRLLATNPAWSGWTSAGAFPTATADYDARTTGFTFDYEEKQLKATYTGMPAGWTFTVRVLIVKVDQTTSAVTNVETLVFTPTADGSGNASITADVVPAEQGYTWRVQSVGHYH